MPPIPASPPNLTLPSKRRTMDENLPTTDNTRLANIELGLKRSRSLQTPGHSLSQSFRRFSSVKNSPQALHSLSFTTARQKITTSTRLADIEAALKESNSPHAPVPRSTTYRFPSISGSFFTPPQPSSNLALSFVPVRVTTPTHTKAFDAAKSGGSICIHGAVNSPLILDIIRELQAKYRDAPDSLVIAATNEISGSNMNCIPLHEFVGVFPADTNPALVFAATKQIPAMNERWMKARTLIIQDVHLLDGRYLDIIDQAARFIKYNLFEPFGGLQLIVTGDFFRPFLQEADHVFAFEAKAWITETYLLDLTALRDLDSSAINPKVLAWLYSLY